MTTLTNLAILLAVACCLSAVLPASAGTQVLAPELGPDHVSSATKTAEDQLTADEKARQLQELFNGASKEIFGYLKNLAKRRIAEDADDDRPGSAESASSLLGRFRRAADSIPGTHHEHHSEVHVAVPVGVSGYPPATPAPHQYAAVVPAPVLVGEIIHNYPAVSPVPVPAAPVQYAAPPQYAPPPKYAPPAQYGPPPQPPPQYGPPPQYAPQHAPPAARLPRPVYWSQPPVKAKSFPEIWDLFIGKPLSESYNDFLAYIPVNALYSLVFEHQYLDFESLRTYTANRFGFITAMQNVFNAPSEQLEEIGRFFDMMTRVLPTRFFGEGRSVDDLLREIRLYFAVNYPLLQFLAPPRNVTAHYYAK